MFADCHRDRTALLLRKQQTHRLWRLPPASPVEGRLPRGSVDRITRLHISWMPRAFVKVQGWFCPPSAFSAGQDGPDPACFTLFAAEFWAWGWGSCSTLSWNAVDFLNPHQSILGLRGRAYLKPPFPRELRLESVSEQLADPPPQLLSFVLCVDPKVKWRRTSQMKKKIVHVGKVTSFLNWACLKGNLVSRVETVFGS